MAPDFTATVVDGETESEISLERLRGEVVVLVFYPKDNTYTSYIKYSQTQLNYFVGQLERLTMLAAPKCILQSIKENIYLLEQALAV